MNSNEEEEIFYDCHDTSAEDLKTSKLTELKSPDRVAAEEDKINDSMAAARSDLAYDDLNTNADSPEQCRSEQNNDEEKNENDSTMQNIKINESESNATAIPQALPEDHESPDESDSESLTESEIEERKAEANILKEEGNQNFRKKMYVEAKELYTDALKICPKILQHERSVMHSNRSACLMKLGEKESAIEDCTKAIELNPRYVKAILRRAQLYEELDKLDEALKDYNAVIETDPSIHTARAACLRLPDKIKERNERLKEEMISKLKDLGNMVLRPFGLSTDNFNMQQDPSTGSYNIQFQNQPN